MAATYILANKERCGGLGGNVGSVALIGETSEHPGSGVPARTRNQHIRQLIYIALIAGQGHIGARRPQHTARLGTIAFHSKYSLPATITARPQREDARKQAHLTTRPARDRGAAGLRSVVSDQNKHACSSAARKGRLHFTAAAQCGSHSDGTRSALV